jgi:hypothetical protein
LGLGAVKAGTTITLASKRPLSSLSLLVTMGWALPKYSWKLLALP